MLIFLRMKWLAVKHIICVCQYFYTISHNALVYLFLIVQKAVRYRLLTNGAQVWCLATCGIEWHWSRVFSF
jgi:hypothetical protein